MTVLLDSWNWWVGCVTCRWNTLIHQSSQATLLTAISCQRSGNIFLPLPCLMGPTTTRKVPESLHISLVYCIFLQSLSAQWERVGQSNKYLHCCCCFKFWEQKLCIIVKALSKGSSLSKVVWSLSAPFFQWLPYYHLTLRGGGLALVLCTVLSLWTFYYFWPTSPTLTIFFGYEKLKKPRLTFSSLLILGRVGHRW